MGSKSKKTTTTNQKQQSTQTAAPPSWTAPMFPELSADLMDAYQQSRNTPAYTGDFGAIPDQARSNELSTLYRQAGAASGAAGQQAMDMATQLMNSGGPTFDGPAAFNGFEQPFQTPDLATYSADAWDGGTNGEARLNAAMEAAQQPVFRQLMEQVLPSIKSSALQSGAYTGDRAMMVEPERALAEASTRANEITQQLAYQGYQAEQDRSLNAWQSFEQQQLAAANAANSAALQAAGLGLDARGQEADALQRQYAMSTDRGLGATQAEQNNYSLAQQGMMDSLLMQTANADLFGNALNNDTATQQARINNDLARHDYNLNSPYQGMDIATQLANQLSSGYGTQTSNGTSSGTTTEVAQTGGLGPILQGMMGLGMGAAGLGVFGPLGGAAGGVGSAMNAADIFRRGAGASANGYY